MLSVALLLMAGAALISANPVDVHSKDPSTVLPSLPALTEVVEGHETVQQELLRVIPCVTQDDLQQLNAGSSVIYARSSTNLPVLPVPQTRRRSTSSRPIKPLREPSAGKVDTGGPVLPTFDKAAPHNVSSLVGRSAYLHCLVHNLGNKSVSWVRQRDYHILTVGRFTYISDQRFNVIHSLDSQDWILKISDAQVRDSGSYVCQVHTDHYPVRSYQVYLNVYELACPDPFIPIGDECFNFLLEDLSWEDSKQRCGTLGAALAEPKNITQVRLYINVNFPRKSHRNFWIGGINNNKVWEWLSGTPLPNDYWHTNEPSGNGECLAMFDGWDRPLTDFPCESPRRAVCEKRITWEPTTEQQNQL